MNLITRIPNTNGKERVVIIGGGFAGLELAKKIDQKKYQIVLIDKNNYYQFQPLFYQVASSGLEPSSITYPHRKSFQRSKNFHFRMCKAQEVLPKENILRTNIGDIPYDKLIISTGCDTNYFGNDKLREDTFPLKSVSESLLLRNRILLSFEEALSAKNEDELKETLTFVIVGGGATGVELAGALADMRSSILPKDYPEIDFDKMEIHLIDASPRILSSMSEKASTSATNALIKRNIILHQNISVKSYNRPEVELSNEEKIISRNVFWVAGVKPNSLNGLAETAYHSRGRILVNKLNQVNGYNDIFAIGDTAILITEENPKGHPQVAQVAIQMAKNLARNLNNFSDEKEYVPFVYHDRGSLATIGRNAAVADLGRFRFGGRFAWWLWLWVHILSIIGMRNRIAVFIDWVWNYLNYDVSLRLLIKPKANKMYEEQ